MGILELVFPRLDCKGILNDAGSRYFVSKLPVSWAETQGEFLRLPGDFI
jgi:hypothetical protein